MLDEDGAAGRARERGEIYATGANISPGYYEDPEGSAAKFTPDGLRTGDLAVVDDDGYIFIVDRRDDFIKSWGHRISSQEIEEAALRMEQLVSAAVVGVPDDEAGEAVTLFVTARPGAEVTPDEVLAVCRQHLPKHMVPRSVLDPGRTAAQREREDRQGASCARWPRGTPSAKPGRRQFGTDIVAVGRIAALMPRQRSATFTDRWFTAPRSITAPGRQCRASLCGPVRRQGGGGQGAAGGWDGPLPWR